MRCLDFLAVTAWAFVATSALTSLASEPDAPPSEGVIRVQFAGRLQTGWSENGPRLVFATIQAGGTNVQIDPAGCPKITSELINYNNELGGDWISETRAVIEGEMVFVAFSETDQGKLKGPLALNLHPDTLIPVVRVKSLKITVLPAVSKSRRVNRDRDLVRSTTVGISK